MSEPPSNAPTPSPEPVVDLGNAVVDQSLHATNQAASSPPGTTITAAIPLASSYQGAWSELSARIIARQNVQVAFATIVLVFTGTLVGILIQKGAQAGEYKWLLLIGILLLPCFGMVFSSWICHHDTCIGLLSTFCYMCEVGFDVRMKSNGSGITHDKSWHDPRSAWAMRGRDVRMASHMHFLVLVLLTSMPAVVYAIIQLRSDKIGYLNCLIPVGLFLTVIGISVNRLRYWHFSRKLSTAGFAAFAIGFIVFLVQGCVLIFRSVFGWWPTQSNTPINVEGWKALGLAAFSITLSMASTLYFAHCRMRRDNEILKILSSHGDPLDERWNAQSREPLRNFICGDDQFLNKDRKKSGTTPNS